MIAMSKRPSTHSGGMTKRRRHPKVRIRKSQMAPGTYQAIFGVYTGGQRSPDQCVEVEFEVDGNTTVTAPAMVAPCDLGN
jgi:hypothetical protein